MSGDPATVPGPAELGAQAARLGFHLDDAQVADMHAAVSGAEAAAAALRDRPVDPGAADPARGDRWVRDRAHVAPAWTPRPGGGAAESVDGREPLELDATGLLRAYGSGRVRPGDVVAAALLRLQRAHAELNCTITLLADRATRAAAESDRRWAEGTARPLEGVPFTVKDVIDVAGVPTTAGSLRRGHTPAARSATVVARLEDAGAIAIAKDATTEFAVGGPHPRLTGACRNPWDPRRWAGGSSTGTAAAVASRVVPFGVGTDVGGSVRLPSAWCGLTGLKPTAGTVPRTGVEPLSWTTETVGPLTRSARDTALLLSLLRGPDGTDARIGELAPFTEPAVPADLAGLRVAVPGGYLTELCDGAVRDGLAALVDELVRGGAQVVPGEIPSAAHALPIGYQLVFAEAAALHRFDAGGWDEYDPVTVRRISQGITTPATDLLRALQFRVELQAELDTVFAGADLVVVPTTPSTAPVLPDCTVRVDGVEHPLYAAQSRSTMLGNLTGAPGLALPTGFGPDGCPVSAQLIAPPHHEALALAVAAWFQQRSDHHLRTPPITDRIR
ncbi:amidase [Pseudonocardia sp. KRD291]|uniref:amidase n=1 Tax=Pseudonocardia sp. KRD291 TaxID=2792007 RepID=UPI001CF7CC97|nr:amidase [Pseudonocardia sp. KRD291]